MRYLFLATWFIALSLQAKPFDKVFMVVLENTSYQSAIKQSFLKEIADRGALFEKFHAVGRPSQPNYIAMVGGDTLGVISNDNYDLDDLSIVDLLEAKGKTWTVYAEDYPGDCFLGATAGRYVRKHQPLISFKNIQQDPKRCSRIVNANAMKADYEAGHIADYVLYVPNLDNDGHDTTPGYANRWMRQTFAKMLADSNFLADRLFITTFDEAAITDSSNRIYTSFLGGMVKGGTKVRESYDFYSLMRTIELAMGLDDLGKKDKTATPITGVWTRD